MINGEVVAVVSGKGHGMTSTMSMPQLEKLDLRADMMQEEVILKI